MSSSKLSANRSTSSSGPSSPQNIDLSQSDFNSPIIMSNDSKPFQKSYPVVYGELVILGFVLSLLMSKMFILYYNINIDITDVCLREKEVDEKANICYIKDRMPTV
jgi:hypothetical protein